MTECKAHDMAGRNLRESDLTSCTLFGVDLRGSNLFGAKIALECRTFDGAKLDDKQVSLLLLLVTLADINPQFQDGLRDLVRRVAGDDVFQIFERYLKLV